MVKNKASMGILFRKIKHELEGLSLANGSLSRSHILVAGLLGAGIGAAGLVLGLKDIKMGNLQISWPSRCKCTSETTYYMAGLQNLGNNCFFNVVLQALASCGCFFSYLEDMLNTIDLEYKEVVEEVPLAAALVSLLNDLCITHEEAIVLNPRKVMVAMSLHLNNFILTRQQDAAEAFIHLMSSLQEELLECYTPCHGSLADITGFPGNVVSLISENSKDLRQWQKLRFGPFDGIIGSMLICANCSTQLSINFEIFRCLPLTPIVEDYSNIMDGRTVISCLRKLIAKERLDSHHCGRCWHNLALKYLSYNAEANAEKIKIIGGCFKQDSCDCAKFLHPEVNGFCSSSQTFKQLQIAHCPMVLCLHLHRASVNHHGDIIKLTDHVSFPVVLDLFPFTMEARTEIPANIGKHFDTVPFMRQISHQHACEDMRPRNRKSYKYRLVSVVEHYGNPGSGHYALYKKPSHRKVGDSLLKFDDVDLDQDWFYISDGEVSRVTMEAVLSAEASLLFYEKIGS